MKINSNSINKSADTINQCVNSFSNDIRKLNSVIDSINTAWEGADALKYINAMKNVYINELNDLMKNIGNFSSDLKNVPQAYQLFDDIFANRNINI